METKAGKDSAAMLKSIRDNPFNFFSLLDTLFEGIVVKENTKTSSKVNVLASEANCNFKPYQDNANEDIGSAENSKTCISYQDATEEVDNATKGNIHFI